MSIEHPQKMQNLNCLTIQSRNFVRDAYLRNKLSFCKYIDAGINPVVNALPIVICRVLPILKVIAT
jgi:hypothetical protein